MTVALTTITSGEAETAVAQLENAMDQLLAVIEQETRLVRSGHVTDAVALDTRKSMLARAYTDGSARIKANKDLLARVLPAKMRALTERHRHLQTQLQANMTVLATAHAVSQDIIRGVSGELTRKASPSTYSAVGKANAPSPLTSQPIAVSRSI
jgi:flagellar biosynthesis/type III secretory pathway chaperone